MVHCPWLLISFTMVFVPNCSVFSKLYKFCGLRIYFLESCTTIKKLYNQRKKLYIFGTLSLALNFIHNGVCTKLFSFFQSCTNSVVLICIFLKSCTNIKKLYIFGTLSLALNFIHNGVCTKLFSFFQSCTNSVVLIYTFLKSCTTIKMLYNQRKKHNIFGTLYLALNVIHNSVCTKMYSFFQSCTNSVVPICIFLKSCTTIKKLYNQRKEVLNGFINNLVIRNCLPAINNCSAFIAFG